MQALVDEGMRDGAYGLSTGLEYVPGRFSEPREVVELTRPVKKYRRVLHQPRAQRGPRSDVARQVRSDAVRRFARRGEGNDQHRPPDGRAGGRVAPQSQGCRFLGREPRRHTPDPRSARAGSRGLRRSVPVRHVRQRWLHRPDTALGAGAARCPGRWTAGRNRRPRRPWRCESQPAGAPGESGRGREGPCRYRARDHPARRRLTCCRLRLSGQEVRREEHRVDRQGPRHLAGRCRHLDSTERIRPAWRRAYARVLALGDRHRAHHAAGLHRNVHRRRHRRVRRRRAACRVSTEPCRESCAATRWTAA